MAAPASISAVRPRHGVKFGPHKMLAARTAMATSAKNPDLIDKI
jgi:hypothetical protein